MRRLFRKAGEGGAKEENAQHIKTPENSRFFRTVTQLEKRPEKLHWVEDEARLELALWVADYANAALAERGATALIKTLNLPQTEMFRMVFKRPAIQ